ncbi:MAG: SAM-dependent methyltransferase [Candidatus Woesearchaeota archaeon]
MIILSHYEAQPIYALSKFGDGEVETSLDLGITTSKVRIEGGKLHFPSGESCQVSELQKIIKDEKSCFFLDGSEFKKVAVFSEETNLYYKLFPTGGAPTIEISGIRMHRTKDMSPWEDSQSKISSLGSIFGKVLDTCTGLGYTAILASKNAEEVHTFEKDKAVLKLQRINPWSRELFSNKKIILHEESIISGINSFRDDYFDFIIHDPPSILIAGELYSDDFYKKLYLKLKQGGYIYHYTGKPGSKFRNVDLMGSVAKRFRRIGFKNVVCEEKVLGVLARK